MAAGAALSLGIIALVLGGSPSLCDQIDRLVHESETRFESIIVAPIARSPGDWTTSFAVGGSDECTISLDPERAGYLCSWEFDQGDDGSALYEQHTNSVRSCVGEQVLERLDALVNHPDFFESTYFTESNHEISVSLKNKNELQKVFVSIGVDGFTATG
ncbi:MAG: hypothetical protein ACI81L_001485 [Verrucomicrobiales bacterium]|jgi:hypothetical protein